MIVERSGYGRQLMASLAEAFAERGYHYVLQTVRGIDGSGGEHDVFAEPADGRVTVDWIDEQPWFDGNLGVNGASYMGFTAYSLASTRPPSLKAMCVSVFGSDRRFAWLSGGSLAWELVLGWNVLQWRLAQSGAGRTMEEVAEGAGLRLSGFDDAFAHLPMGEAREAHDRRGHPPGHAAARALRARRPLLGPAGVHRHARRLRRAHVPHRQLVRLPAPAHDRRLPDPRRVRRGSAPARATPGRARR